MRDIERVTEIERENRILFEKMQKIMLHNKSPVNGSNNMHR